jgi:hypothetical protein
MQIGSLALDPKVLAARFTNGWWETSHMMSAYDRKLLDCAYVRVSELSWKRVSLPDGSIVMRHTGRQTLWEVNGDELVSYNGGPFQPTAMISSFRCRSGISPAADVGRP